jgi:hypothetical protein
MKSDKFLILFVFYGTNIIRSLQYKKIDMNVKSKKEIKLLRILGLEIKFFIVTPLKFNFLIIFYGGWNIFLIEIIYCYLQDGEVQ